MPWSFRSSPFLCNAAVSAARVCRLVALMPLYLVANSTPVQADVLYQGTLGKRPIQLFGDAAYGRIDAAYVYQRYDTPIRLRGSFVDGIAVIDEFDAAGELAARLRLIDFDPAAAVWHGEWTSLDGKRTLPIRLQREFAIDGSDQAEPDRRYPQAASDESRYFQLLVRKPAGDYYPRVVALEVYRKGSDELLQRIEVNTEFRGLHGVSIGNYNFDERPDLALFEASYAGPNTSSLYFLQQADGRYVQAEFSGTSLEFDAERKLVYEHNQCCAGRSHMNATYQVVGNRLELIERRCNEYDEKTDDLVEVPCDGDDQ